jgi:hypothetical protein
LSYNLSATWILFIIFLAIWELSWKGAALWRAGRNNQLAWFIVLLVLNSGGILSIIYLLSHSKLSDDNGLSIYGRIQPA